MELEKDFINYPFANRVVLELTEQDISLDMLKNNLKRVRRTGIKIAIDDFGSGFSNLLRIGELEPDYIKLDRSFINNIQENEKTQKLLPQLVKMSDVLGAYLIVEGIEKKEQLEIVKQSGVIFGQGFYLANPSFLKNK